MENTFNLKKFLAEGKLNEEQEDYETLYDFLARKMGYQDSEQMFQNSDEISDQAKILANYICELKNKSSIFHDVKSY